jgi:DNA polymerase-1
MSARRLLLVDGTQLFYRSFFGIRGLSTHEGQPSNAVFGFIRGIHQLLDVWNPSHWAVAWDGGSPKTRLDLLPEYKAQRPPMPDDLRRQVEPVREFLKLAGIPLIRLEQQEADDVLASLAHWGERNVDDVIIVTSDKDLYQLVSEKTGMAAWGKDDKRLGRAEVFEKTGVHPGQIIEWLALTGDAVDNISGVEGMGPKTAAKLLGQFGSLDVMWSRLDEIHSARIRANLITQRDRVERNLALVRLRIDLPCCPEWDTLAVKPEWPAVMRPFYARMDFHSLIKASDQGELF